MKLQYENNEHYLMKDGVELAIATTDESFIKELGAERLSRKNCQAIFNGYDLDELAENHALEVYDKVEADEDYQDYANFNNRRNNFKEGFQKALEILGDKKFSEEDLVSFGKRCFYKGFKKSENDDANCYTAFREEIGELIQSLQKTEWDVEVETENSLTNGYKNQPENIIGFISEYKSVPKLDENGCLILKRK